MDKNTKLGKNHPSEYEKMISGEWFNPADKSFLLLILKSEHLQHKLNKCPLWMQGRKNRILKQLLGSIDGMPYNVFLPFRVVYGKNVHIGKNFFSNWNLCLQDYAKIQIGDNVFIGPNVSIVTIIHPINSKERMPKSVPNSLISGDRGNYEKALPVKIGNNVLIYTGVVICPGVTIGDNSIIGAGSVVTRSLPANVFACGTPCKVIKEIMLDNTSNRH